MPADCELHPIHLYFIRGYDTSAYCVPVTQALDLLTVSTTVQELERQISIGLPVFRAPLAGCEDDGLMHMIRISDLPELGAAYKRASMGIEILKFLMPTVAAHHDSVTGKDSRADVASAIERA